MIEKQLKPQDLLLDKLRVRNRLILERKMKMIQVPVYLVIDH